MSAAQYFNQSQPTQDYQPSYSDQQYQSQPKAAGHEYNNNGNAGGYGQSYSQQPQQPQQGYQHQQNYAPPPPGPPPGPPPHTNYGMKPSQPYAAPPPGPPPPNGGYAENNGNGYQDTAPFSQATEKTGERLNPKKRLNDPIFLALFIAAVAGFAVLSGIAIKSFVDVNGLGGGFGDATQGGTGTAITLD